MKIPAVPALFVLVVFLATPRLARSSGHGPVFGLATPTNPKGGFSVELSAMGRAGQGQNGAMLRGSVGYGLTPNLKLSVSAPVMLKAEPLAPARMSALMPMTGDIEALFTWRFHRQDTGVGSRFESALVGGILLPGPQDMGGVLANVDSGAGGYLAGVTGFASRSNYFWVGAGYQRYSQSNGDRRPDLVSYSVAYAYRPPSWRTDEGWDWRIFAELTGERSGIIRRDGFELPRSESTSFFSGRRRLGSTRIMPFPQASSSPFTVP